MAYLQRLLSRTSTHGSFPPALTELLRTWSYPEPEVLSHTGRATYRSLHSGQQSEQVESLVEQATFGSGGEVGCSSRGCRSFIDEPRLESPGPSQKRPSLGSDSYASPSGLRSRSGPFFSTQTTAAPEASASVSGDSSEKVGSGSKRGQRTALDVLKPMPNWGVGAKLAKSHWHENNYYQVTEVQVYKDAKHGAAWGIRYENDAPVTGVAQKIGGANKKGWREVRK